MKFISEQASIKLTKRTTNDNLISPSIIVVRDISGQKFS